MDIVAIFSQLAFPVAVAAYLLWERTQSTEKVKSNLARIEIAMYLMLDKLDLIPDFEAKIREIKAMKEGGK